MNGVAPVGGAIVEGSVVSFKILTRLYTHAHIYIYIRARVYIWSRVEEIKKKDGTGVCGEVGVSGKDERRIASSRHVMVALHGR